jgi:hypothetical protein
MINPLVIGKGTPILSNLANQVNLKPVKSNIFKSGALLLYYAPEMS